MSNLPSSIYEHIPAGTAVKVRFKSVSHYGIADGFGNIVHNSKKHGMVVSEPAHHFSDGKVIQYSNIRGANPQLASQIAYNYIGMSYKLFSANCEHFVRLCHGLEQLSPQLEKYVIAITGSTIALKSSNQLVRMSGVAIALTAIFTLEDEAPVSNAFAATAIVIGLYAIFS